MLSVPAEILSRVRGQYPTIDIRWNQKKQCFEVLEIYAKGAVSATRLIWDYENFDGSRAPIIGDVVMSFLHRADTRKWPLEERMKLYDKEREDKVKSDENKFSDVIQSSMIEDYNYIAGIPTFFMNPSFHFKSVGVPE